MGPGATEKLSTEDHFSGIADHILLRKFDTLLEATADLAYPVVSEDNGGHPGEGSLFARDIEEFGQEAVGRVQLTCGTWHMVASQHLQAIASVHHDSHLLFAPAPLLRSSLEHVVRVGWVLDGADARHRAARAWLASVVANGDDAHTHRNAGNPSPALAGAPERLETLCTDTIPGLFDEVQPDRSARRPADWTLLGERWGDNTTACETFFQSRVRPESGAGLDGRVQYRLSSMFTHPSTTASWAFAKSTDYGATFSWDIEHTGVRIAVGLLAYYFATRDLYDFLGWQPESVPAWHAHLMQVLTEFEARRNSADRI